MPPPLIFVTSATNDSVMVAPQGFLSERQWDSYQKALSVVETTCVRGGIQIPARQAQLFIESLGGAISCNLTESALAIVQEASLARPPINEHVGQERLLHFTMLNTGRYLYPYQEDCVRWLAPRQDALLALDMGTGKSAVSLVSLPPGAATLAIVPAVVVTNWQREANMWRPDFKTAIVKKRTEWRMPGPGEILISTYGMIPDDPTTTIPPGMVLISDEASALKGTTARHRSFKALHKLNHAAGGATWLLTGTPLQNHPPELWNVLSCAGLEREAFTSWPRFCHLFGGAKTKFIPVKGRRGGRRVVEWSGKPRPEVNACLQKVWLRRTKEEVLPDLPAKRRTDVFLGSLDQATAKACDEAMAALAAAGVHLTGDDSDDLLDKIKDPDHVSQLAKARAQLAAAKVAPCVEIVEEFEEAEEPIVVASAYVAPCKALGARPGWACITGETPTAERGRIVDRFQAGELKGLALTYRAGGVGITLTRASNMILLDLDWTPAQISQMEDRECRIGQTRGVLIQRLVADHALDRHVIRLLTRKQRMIDEVERKAP